MLIFIAEAMDKDSSLQVHVLNSLRRNQERIESQTSKLGKHRAKYFGELALSQKVAAHKNKQHGQLELLSKIDPANLLGSSSSDFQTYSPTKSSSASLPHQELDVGDDYQPIDAVPYQTKATTNSK